MISRGFFTSRVIGQYINEGLAMQAEGVDPMSLKRAATQSGYPTGTLQISGQLNLELMKNIRIASRTAVEAEGGTWEVHPSEKVIDTMIELGRSSKLVGKGFYEYDEAGKSTGLWPGLAEQFPVAAEQPDFQDLKDRLVFVMSLDTVRCLEENVLRTVADTNIGPIFGIGFLPLLGGVLQYINGYEAPDGRIGIEAFGEADVLRLLARGMSNAQISRALFISEGTAKTHAARMLAKLRLRDRVQVVVLAYEHDLIEPGVQPGTA